MNPEDLLAQHEGKTLEFKRNASSSGPILKTLSAFSNTAGGTLVLGVRDRTREVIGIHDPLSVEEQIMNIASDGIRPQILPEVEIISFRRTNLVTVTVFPGPHRPYYVRSLGQKEGSYVRVGSTNRKATSEVLAELDRVTRNVAFDEEPMGSLTLADLDLETARARFEGRRKLEQKDLLSLGALTRQGRKLVPTVGGIILFGHNRLRHFPDARIRMARFAGKDRSTITDRAEANSDPVRAIEEAMAFLGRSTRMGMAVDATRRQDLPQFPPIALREAVINAVAHADYSQIGSPIRIAVFEDRVEIENPGLLPFGLTIDEMRQGVSKLRNRVIGRTFHELGLIEQWGSGIQRMTKASEDLGLPPPELEEFGTCFRLTLRSTPSVHRSKPSGTAGRILQLLADGKSQSTASVSATLEVTSRTVRTHLKRLVEAGHVIEIGKGPTDPKRVYRLAAPP